MVYRERESGRVRSGWVDDVREKVRAYIDVITISAAFLMMWESVKPRTILHSLTFLSHLPSIQENFMEYAYLFDDDGTQVGIIIIVASCSSYN